VTGTEVLEEGVSSKREYGVEAVNHEMSRTRPPLYIASVRRLDGVFTHEVSQTSTKNVSIS
jgi:hypothetical protein